jgi:hypothetical protein
MTHTRFARPAKTWLCLAVIVPFAQGCVQQAGWNGVYAADLAGGARTCVAPASSPTDGQSFVVQMQVSNEGGWCGSAINRGGVPFESYLMVTRATHGRVFAHRVGNNTRIDYTPDPGFTGTDSFAVRLIPGNAVFQGAVTVTP